MSKNLKVIRILLIVLAIAVMPANVITIGIGEADLIPKIGAALNILAIMYLIYYIIIGFKKVGSTTFKGFMLFYTCALLMTVVSNAMYSYDNVSPIVVCLLAISFASAFMLTLSKDLGKKKSMILCLVVNVITILTFIMIVIYLPGLRRGGNLVGTIFGIRSASLAVTGIIMTLMTYAKYIDKISRGREV